MPERGPVKLTLRRGATVVEFGRFLNDLEAAYLALYFLPTRERGGRFGRRLWLHFPELLDWDDAYGGGKTVAPDFAEIYPPDRLEIARITIQSPGWVELIGSLNPLQQLREYLKDRHERLKDKEWRSAAEKERASLELEVLRAQAEREKIGVIRDYAAMLDETGLPQPQRDALLWHRIGAPLSRLAEHQESGLLGSQDEDCEEDEPKGSED